MIVYKGQEINWHPQSDSLGVSPLKWTQSTLTLVSGLHCLVEGLRQLICFIGCFRMQGSSWVERTANWDAWAGWMIKKRSGMHPLMHQSLSQAVGLASIASSHALNVRPEKLFWGGHTLVPVMNTIMSLSLFDLVISFLCTAPECLRSKHSFYFPCYAWLIYIDSLDKPFLYL